MSDIDSLHDAVVQITPLVLKAEHSHMRQPWQMILGGLIIPEMVKLDPTVLDDNPTYKELLAQYDKAKVAEFFSTKTVEKKVPVDRIVERVVEKRVTVPSTTDKVVVAEKVRYRRLKDDGVKKIKRMEREILPYDRNTIITWWNNNQRLVPDEDPVCKEIADKINAACPPIAPLAPAQVAGYFSHLCRMGLEKAERRIVRFERNIHYGNIAVMPQYSEKLIEEIKKNNAAEKADESIRKTAHEAMRTAKAAGSHLKVGTPVGIVKTETAAEPTPAVSVVTEDKESFDIKFM